MRLQGLDTNGTSRTGRALIGRRGYGRVHYDSSATRWAKEDPRDAAWLRDFQAGRIF